MTTPTSHRDFLRSGTANMAAGAIVGIGTQGPALAQTAGANASTQPPVGGPGIETQSGQTIYRLPRDHACHGGAFHQSNEYNEWHYITALGRDIKTGRRISAFRVALAQGRTASEGRPLHNVLFAFHNLDTGEFRTSLSYVTGPLKTEGSASAGGERVTRVARVARVPRLARPSLGRRPGIQPRVGEALLDRCPLQDRRDDLQLPGAAARAAPQVDVEHAHDQPRPADVLRPSLHGLGVAADLACGAAGRVHGCVAPGGGGARGQVAELWRRHGIGPAQAHAGRHHG
jgi:hypothetical protein